VSTLLEKLRSQSSDERQQEIIDVLADAFGPLMEAEPDSFRRKFRKMAASPFAFYRGSAPLFYADVATDDDPYANDKTGRVWIQGDLHAENYGSYMNSEGMFVFDVNDFDEAYLGSFTWDVQRMAASIALLGFSKAFSDDDIRELIGTYARSYADQVCAFTDDDDDRDFALRLDNTDGLIHDVLEQARGAWRVSQLDEMTTLHGHQRRFADDPHNRRLDDEEYGQVVEAFEQYRKTIPERQRQNPTSYTIKDIIGRSGMGIGSAGLPIYTLLLEGHTQALENDVLLSMKQGNVAAPSRVVDDQRISEFFHHHGHRTAVSQRALQANTDPWLGWTELNGVGQVVSELSPYDADLDWDAVAEPEEMRDVLGPLGQATAKVHCVADVDADETLVPFQVEDVICEAIDAADGGRDGFVRWICEFGAGYGDQVRDDHRLFVDAFRNGRIPGL
jgi:uncharacterized protein (DUF2252 family)